MSDNEITNVDPIGAEVKCVKNGPYMITNVTSFTDSDGNTTKPSSGKVYLCACGKSQNRPFCDGSHNKNNTP